MKRLVLTVFFISLFFIPLQLAFADSMPSASEQREAVLEFFADNPAMIEVARCESGMRQFTDAGEVLRGGAGGQYIGVFQFHPSHASSALALGYDIETLDGNLSYAKHLYEAEGLRPWSACVDENMRALEVSEETTGESELSREEKVALIADLRRKVKLLTIKLLEIRIEELRARQIASA